MVGKPAASSLGTVGRFKVLLEKENDVSMKLASRWRHEVLLNLLADGAVVDSGLHQPMTGNPKSSLTVGTGIVDCVLLGSLVTHGAPYLYFNELLALIIKSCV